MQRYPCGLEPTEGFLEEAVLELVLKDGLQSRRDRHFSLPSFDLQGEVLWVYYTEVHRRHWAKCSVFCGFWWLHSGRNNDLWFSTTVSTKCISLFSPSWWRSRIAWTPILLISLLIKAPSGLIHIIFFSLIFSFHLSSSSLFFLARSSFFHLKIKFLRVPGGSVG